MMEYLDDNPEPGQYGSLRALVVDDDPDTREMLEMLLTSIGWSVVVVGSAEEAIERFDPVGTDILLTDLSMPGMDGHELLERLRQRSPRRLPAIAISGYDAADYELPSSSGFDAHVVKPFGLATLVEIARRIGREN